ncbi:hypothetical protein HANVADRAFT_114742 [Hanseniaspora valbyensis NRRL Y-1626]|uniref:Uncharacterized protein n=1 Tax=Hanseniaspora valbyensis NRRL Y-1626 TaxID=766949 RepID=A0A1B7TG94_9ASCO|nr:hypothetical protein HANVADRAFT_114742 [Hanseniaspora valbyensis NRRL Y-1626]
MSEVGSACSFLFQVLNCSVYPVKVLTILWLLAFVFFPSALSVPVRPKLHSYFLSGSSLGISSSLICSVSLFSISIFCSSTVGICVSSLFCLLLSKSIFFCILLVF